MHGAADRLDAPRFLAQLVESMGQAVVATAVDGTIRYWNLAAERLYGWTAHEVLGHNILDITPPQVAREQAQAIMGQLQAGRPWSGTFPVRWRDGSTFVATVTDTPVLDADGHLIAIVGVSNNLDAYVRSGAAAEDRLTPARLTPRQLEVVALIRHGQTNAEIARQLVLEQGTVANHIVEILRRLELRNRVQLSAWAVAHRIDARGPGAEPSAGPLALDPRA